MPPLAIEPGRGIAGPGTITVYEVGTVKPVKGLRTFVSVDGGMSDNIRTALYGADYTVALASRDSTAPPMLARVVGKHCESGDVVVTDTWLPGDLAPGDLLAVAATGAYCRSMASTYNHVPRPPVVAVREGGTRRPAAPRDRRRPARPRGRLSALGSLRPTDAIPSIARYGERRSRERLKGNLDLLLLSVLAARAGPRLRRHRRRCATAAAAPSTCPRAPSTRRCTGWSGPGLLSAQWQRGAGRRRAGRRDARSTPSPRRARPPCGRARPRGSGSRTGDAAPSCARGGGLRHDRCRRPRRQPTPIEAYLDDLADRLRLRGRRLRHVLAEVDDHLALLAPRP